MAPIAKDWLESVGFRVVETPDRRKREQLTKYVLTLPYHLSMHIHYWEYPKCSGRDGIVASSGTYGGSPLRLPSRCTESREALSEVIKAICGVDILALNAKG